ncbi:unnamed protein product, partial [Mesorhabditis spiculigera]
MHSILPLRLLWLISAVSATQLLDIGCSSKPHVIGCRFVRSSDIPLTSPSIDWGHFAPEDVGIFDLIKPNVTTGALALESKIRWKVPIGQLPHELLGFQVTITERTGENRKTYTYLAKLNRSIHRVNNAVQQADFFLKLNGLFKFGNNYDLKISFYPPGSGGIAKTEKIIPPWLEKTDCDLRYSLKKHRVKRSRQITPRDMATLWSTSFQAIELYPARSSVNVTFATAPAELCINSYIVRLKSDATGQVLVTRGVEAEPNMFIWQLFENLPFGMPFIVEVVPAVNKDGYCPCSNCNCVTTSSKAFELAEVKAKAPIPREPLQVAHSTPGDSLWLFALILLAAIVAALMILIAIVIFYHRKILKTEEHLKLTLAQEAPKFPSLKEKRIKAVLIIARNKTHIEKYMCDKLARALANSGARVRYEEWEHMQVEENIFQWIAMVLRDVDSILLVHGQKAPDYQLSPGSDNRLLSMIKPTDPRLVHASWGHYRTDSPYIETVFNLPRHAPLLCAALCCKFIAEQWKPVLKACEERLKLPRIGMDSELVPIDAVDESEDAALLGEQCSTEIEVVDEEQVLEVESPIVEEREQDFDTADSGSVDSCQMDTILVRPPPVPVPAPATTQCPQTPVQADSAYASLNTYEIHA